MSYAQLRYAVNEMYARHGATFPSEPPIQAQFREFSWYHPNPKLTVEQIEASFSQIEKDNLELLAQERDLKNPIPTPTPTSISTPTATSAPTLVETPRPILTPGETSIPAPPYPGEHYPQTRQRLLTRA